jgi:ankyrin repeat protein
MNPTDTVDPIDVQQGLVVRFEPRVVLGVRVPGARPDAVELSADAIVVKGGVRPGRLAWRDVAAVEVQAMRLRIAFTARDGRALYVPVDMPDRAEFLDRVATHVEGSRRGDDADAVLARVRRPATFVRGAHLQAALFGALAGCVLLGLLLDPIAFGAVALLLPVLLWRWTTEPQRVVVDDSAIRIVRPLVRDVIPLQAVRDVAIVVAGRMALPCIAIDHRERGAIVLTGLGAGVVPLFDAVSGAVRARKSGARAVAVMQRAEGSRRVALRPAAMAAAALLALAWVVVFTGAPLRTAVRTGSDGLLNASLLAGSLRSTADADGMTALHHAALRNESGMVERLVRAGADVDARSKRSLHAPLHTAAAAGSEDAVRALIVGGADVDARTARGRTPLAYAMLASAAPSPAIARMLIDAGADAAATDSVGRTALHHAAAQGHVEWIALLVRAGTPVNARDTAGYAPLHLAALHHRADAITALVAAGADVDARARLGRTALARAAHDRATPAPVIDALLAARARADIPGDDGWNAAQLAAAANNAPALELFARRRARLDATTRGLEPALHIAIRAHHVDAVRALLRGGASPSRAYLGLTGYDVARQTNNPTITALVRMRS